MSFTYTSFSFPVYINDECVESIEIDDDPNFDPRIDQYCPNNAAHIRADIYPYLVCYKILEAVDLFDRLACLDTDEPFKMQLRNMFPEIKRSTLNYLRRYIAARTVTTMFFQNIWFDLPIEDIRGLPPHFVLGSVEFRIWNNFKHTDLEHRSSLVDTLRMTDNEYLSMFRDDLLRSSSEKAIKRIHDEVTKEYNIYQELINAEKLSRSFPEYEWPVAPPPEITQIKSGQALMEEGRYMNHCVGSYVDLCLDKRSYIFHVKVGKDEATLELGEGGTVKQFKSFCNKEPTPACYKIVNQWLH